jgi:hypothetical protein
MNDLILFLIKFLFILKFYRPFSNHTRTIQIIPLRNSAVTIAVEDRYFSPLTVLE